MTTPAPSTDATSRRSMLKLGSLGVAGAAFLAACSSDKEKAGQSGTPATTTAVAPAAPEEEYTAARIEADNVMLMTGSSLELLVAAAYKANAAKVTSPEWSGQMARIQADHESTALMFSQAAKGDDPRATEPNEFLQTGLVDPAAGSLVDEASTLSFLASLESMLTATYATWAGNFTTAKWRQKVMTSGGAAARRAALLGNGGTGAAPRTTLYPLVDLIPTNALLTAADDTATTTTTEAN